MMFVRAVGVFLFQLGVALAIALGIAAVWAAAAGGSFRFRLAYAGLILGVVTILLGFIGMAGPSAASRYLARSTTLNRPGARVVNANAILVLTGIGLLALGSLIMPPGHAAF